MKRYLLLLWWIWLTGLAAQAQPGPQSYYYFEGRRVSLSAHATDWSVVFPASVAIPTIQAAMRSQFPAAAFAFKPVPGRPSQFYFRAASPSDVNPGLVRNWLRLQAPLAIIQPLLVDQLNFSYLPSTRFFAKLKPGVSITRAQQWIDRQPCRTVGYYPYDSAVWEFESTIPQADAIQLAARFFESGWFDFAEPDLAGFDLIQTPPNDPLYGRQWGHVNTGSADQFNGTPGADVDADLAWTITRGSASIRIAVLDVGVQRSHPDLAANIDPLGYGLIAPVTNTGDVLDTAACHGTACAGILAAVADNHIGVAGVAPGCKIIPVNIARNNTGLFGTFSQIAGAIDWAWSTAGADVLSNSWGGGSPSTLYRDAIRRAVTNGRGGKGAVVVFSAGNANSGIFSPSSFTDCIAVGAMNMCYQRKSPTSCDGETFWGSNYGFGLDLVAPGVKIATTWNTGLTSLVNYNPAFNGTSAAAPFVSATAALMLSVNPQLTQQAVREIIERTTRKVGNYLYAAESTQPNGSWNPEMGHGLLNTYQAVLAAQNPPTYCPVSIRAPGNTQICSGSSVTLSVVNPVAGGQYQWQLNGSALQTGTSISATLAGQYQVTWLSPTGCRDTSGMVAVTLGQFEGTLSADAGRDTTVCQNSRVFFGGAPSGRGGTPILSSQRGFAYSVSENALYRFDPVRPQAFRMVKPNFYPGGNSNTLIAGSAITPEGLFMLARVANQLIRVDTATGALQVVGASVPNTNTDWSGLTYNPVSRKLYATAFGLLSDVYEINPRTGAATWLGTLPNSENINLIWIAADTNGDLLTMGLGVGFPAQVYRLGLSPVSLTPLPSALPFEANFAQDAALDSISNRFFQFGNTRVIGSSDFYNGQGIWELNRSTGSAQLIGPLAQSFNQFDGLAFSGKEYRYQWSPATGLDNPNAPNPVFTAPSAGTFTYTLTITDLCGNTATDQLVVTVNPLPAIPTITPSAPMLSHRNGFSETLSFAADPSFQYRWQLNGTNTTNTSATQIVNSLNLTTDRFTVVVTNPLTGCVRSTAAVQPAYIAGIPLSTNTNFSVCDTAFYDAGGATGNTGSGFAQTFSPSQAGLKSTLSLYRLQLATGAVLTVFDGTSVSAPVLAQLSSSQNGTTFRQYAASNPDGALTVRFTPGSSAGVGWFGGITCTQPLVYRTQAAGSWFASSVWESRPSGSHAWAPATRPPVKADDTIFVRHTVTVGQALPIDQVVIESAGQLQVASGGSLQLDKQVLQPEIRVDRGGRLVINAGRQVSGGSAVVEVLGELDVSGFLNAGETRIADNVSQVLRSSGGVGTIAHLVMNNPAGLLLAGEFEVSLLTFQRGVIFSGFLNGLLVEETLGGSDQSYVQGPVRARIAAGAGEKQFPTGLDGRFRPVWLSASSSGSQEAALVQAELLPGAPAFRTLPLSLGGVADNRFVKLTLLNAPNSTSGYRIRYTYGPEDGVFNPAGLRLARAGEFDASWTDQGGSASTALSGTIQSTPFNTLGDVALAWAVGQPIPVRLLQFTGRAERDGNRLFWQVALEQDLRGYRIEGSSDGVRFDSLGWVPARSLQLGRYEWLDSSPLAQQPFVFYRLQQVDITGQFRSSAVIRLTKARGSIQVYPNPVVGNQFFIRYRSVAPKAVQIRLWSATGALVRNEVRQAVVGDQVWAYVVGALPAGVYVVECTDGVNRYYTRLVRAAR